jgi:hypothetical protein
MISRNRSRRVASRRLRARRGIALFISMFFVAGIGALALSAIYLTANASLIGKSYEKEDDLKYASEAALAIGKASLNFNPAALPNTSFVAMMTDKPMMAADGQAVPNVTVNLWAGPSGSTSGQFGRFASLVAEARDVGGVGFVRRLELSQESFAKYAYWSNDETNIVFGGNDQIWGPVWSNDDITVHSTGAVFHDAVGTARGITGAGNGSFAKGYSTNQRRIELPSLTTLGTLAGLAGVGGMSFTAPSTGSENTVRMRIEFISADMNNNADSTEQNEGFFRVYRVPSTQVAWLRGDWPGSSSSLPAIGSVTNCGDWHKMTVAQPGQDTGWKFFPAAVHPTTWFRDLLDNNGSMSQSDANTHRDMSLTNILQYTSSWAGAKSPRCFLGGDPHLVAISRNGAAGYAATDYQRGGDPTTFTQNDSRGGEWFVANATPTAPLSTKRPWDARNLYPLFRGYNTNTKGVIYVAGTVGVSGTIRSELTLYTPNTLVVLDDLRYANDPARGVCIDIFGMIAGGNVVLANNALLAPVYIRTSTPLLRSLDDTPDTHLHSVIMALGTSFGAEDYDQGPNDGIDCQSTDNGRGCLYLTGGVIRTAMATSSATRTIDARWCVRRRISQRPDGSRTIATTSWTRCGST